MREASTLLSTDFFWHIALFGVLPALVVLFIPLRRHSWKRELASRTALVCASIVLPATALYVQYLEFSFYAQENRHVRLFMNPLYPVYAVGQLVAETISVQIETEKVLATGIARNALQESSKPLAVVLVLGETARADHWSLNGYGRETNPYTKDIGAINFEHVTACGTSTADSLPCLFSPLSRAEFSHVEAAKNESLLAILKRVDINVAWLDNSTGCKGLCDAEDFIFVAGASDGQLCDSNGCYDELLTKTLAESLAGNPADSFIVLHQRGSHGPTYYMNTPEAAKQFLPECRLDTFRDCDDESLQNAYDNTILYTDQFLAQLIEQLGQLEATHDVALLYVSDHGESLGEGGLYLHGFPYALAPDAQKHVPMLFWASERFYQRSGIDPACMDVSRNESYSHDSIFHTSLALMDVEADGYRRDLDVFGACRSVRSAERLATNVNEAEDRVVLRP
jgi:lipid A ethanolaminephosphotransferase